MAGPNEKLICYNENQYGKKQLLKYQKAKTFESALGSLAAGSKDGTDHARIKD
jgi:hypothetical protein